MIVRFNRWYNTILTALLTMLGYGCSSDEPMDMYGPPVEYGTPYADYIVKGQVTDEAGTPIKDIQITAPYGYGTDSQHDQVVQTDAAGNFTLKEFSSMKGYQIIFEDIDGEANGGDFKSDTINVNTLPMTQAEQGSGWYGGKFDVKAEIKLKKK